MIMQKTTINLSDYTEFKKPLVAQISDDPNTTFARVIVSNRELLMEDIKQIELVATTYYVNTATGKIVPQMTHRTLSKGKPWIISNNYNVIVRGADGQPIDNPKHVRKLELIEALSKEGLTDVESVELSNELITLENESEFLMQPAYDRFASFLYNETHPVSLPMIWKMSVDIDDAQGYFDIHEKDKLR